MRSVLVVAFCGVAGCWFDNDFDSFKGTGGAGGTGGSGGNPDANIDASPDALPLKMPVLAQPARSFATTYGQTGGLAVLDVNGDGNADVAAFDPSMSSGLITTFIGDGTGVFPSIQNGGSSGRSTAAIATGIVGALPGVATADADITVSVYENTSPTLGYATSYSLRNSSIGQSIAMAPLDTGMKAWLIEGTNIGLGISAPAAGTNYGNGVPYLDGVSVMGVAVGKFRGAATDVVAVGRDATGANAYILLNTGSGTFGAPQTIPLPATPTAVATGDLDGGGVDIVVTTIDSVYILLNSGNGSFSMSAVMYDAASATSAIALDDFNGDGKIDIAVSSNLADVVAIRPGYGDGTFGSAAVFRAGSRVHGIGVGDFNHDTKPDIVVSCSVGICVLLNTTP